MTGDSENGSKRKSRQEESKRSGKPIPPEKETGVEQQRVDLRNPEPEAQNQTEEQPLLPHERDQTTRPTGTAAPNSIEQARDVIEASPRGHRAWVEGHGPTRDSFGYRRVRRGAGRSKQKAAALNAEGLPVYL